MSVFVVNCKKEKECSWFKVSAVRKCFFFVCVCLIENIKLLVLVLLALLHLSSCSKSLLLFLLLLAPLLIPSRHLPVLCSEEREPDIHISLIMSQLKYQSSAPSHLTKAEVMKPSTLKLNETAQRRWVERELSGWEGVKCEAKARAEVKSNWG